MPRIPVQLVITADEPPASQIVEQIERLLAIGVYRGGDELPGAGMLATELGIARVTVQKAYTALIERKIVEARVGHGTYIRDDADTRRGVLARLFSSAITLGLNLFMTIPEIEKVFSAEITRHAARTKRTKSAEEQPSTLQQ